MIELSGLKYSYPNSQGITLDGLNFSVKTGSLNALLGPNGSGKSTCFKILSTQNPHFEGQVKVSGFDLRQKPQEIRKILGLTFQNPSLDPMLTIRENLSLQMQLYGISSEQIKKRLDSSLYAVGLMDRANDRVKILSGGLARRAELAKNLCLLPKLMLLDEPTTGLDPRARAEFWEILIKIQKEFGMTVLLTTHLMEEAEYCESLIFLNKGRIVGQGSPEELKKALACEIIFVNLINRPKIQDDLKSCLGAQDTLTSYEGKWRVRTQSAEKCFASIRNKFSSQELKSLSIGQPTLSDVFFELTGDKL